MYDLLMEHMEEAAFLNTKLVILQRKVINRFTIKSIGITKNMQALVLVPTGI